MTDASLDPHLHVLVLAGGSGERFWPLSRRLRPKQLLALAGMGSLLSQALDRAQAVCSAVETGSRRRGASPSSRILVLTSRDLAPVLLRELPKKIPRENLIAEPVGRNTGPAVALGCHIVARRDPHAVVVVLPSDHWIPETEPFLEAIGRAVRVARDTGGLVTFGIRPTRPETGYGYIERGAPHASVAGAYRAKAFHEKPDAATAARYVASGDHDWNSGIFVWKAESLLDELAAHEPSLAEALAEPGLGGPEVGDEALAAFFESARPVSIDHAVMEKSDKVWVVEGRFRWSDLGTWDAWGATLEPDPRGNRIEGDAVISEANGNIIYSETGGRVAVLGVDGLIVVRTRDATLVLPRNRVQDVREIVRRMREGDREDPYL
jgi:mannose-1-phosphate guanylyltransferase